MLLSGCIGTLVEADKILLEVQVLGDRDVEISNEDQSQVKVEHQGKKYNLSLKSAQRVVMSNPATRYLIFPKGIEMYRYSQRPSPESLNDESICVMTKDGQVCVDIVVQAKIDTSLPDLAQRLFFFATQHKLVNSGNQDILSVFFKSVKFRPFLEAALKSEVANKPMLYAKKNKKVVNDGIRNYLSKQFEQYGLVFTEATGISSSVRISDDKQKKLNDNVAQQLSTLAKKMYNDQVASVHEATASLKNSNIVIVETILSTAKTEASGIIKAAETSRRKAITEQLGPKRYAQLEKMVSLTSSLADNNANITLVTKDTKVILSPSHVLKQEIIPEEK